MSSGEKKTALSNFKRFFIRGLALLLPSVLTIWLLIAAYSFVKDRIAAPINAGVRELLLLTTDIPHVAADEVAARQAERAAIGLPARKDSAIHHALRKERLNKLWSDNAATLDLIGLILAIMGIYAAGAFLGSFLGRRIYARGEQVITQIPLVKQVYPHVKQVTEFLLGDKPEGELEFRRVVAVQYPRKGIWSVGLVTGNTMQVIEVRAGVPCMTIFIPSSPTPFTGYVITVPVADTIDLPISVEEALKFTVSGGVILPRSQDRALQARLAAAGPGGTIPPATDAPATPPDSAVSPTADDPDAHPSHDPKRDDHADSDSHRHGGS